MPRIFVAVAIAACGALLLCAGSFEEDDKRALVLVLQGIGWLVMAALSRWM